MRTRSITIAGIFLVMCASLAIAAPPGVVDLGTGVTVGNGSVTASGGYGLQAGWTPNQATLYALPMSGGVSAYTAWNKAPANGQWGPATVNNLAVGNYAVYVKLDLTGPMNAKTSIMSAVSIVNVTAPGGVPVVPLGTATYAGGDPTGVQGKISVTKNGMYNPGGNVVVGNQLEYFPMTGGTLPGLMAGPVPANGKWGPITTNVVPPGQYLVFGGVLMKQGMNPAQTVYTPGSIVNVP